VKKNRQKEFVDELLKEINSNRKGKPITQNDMSEVLGYAKNAVAEMKRGRHTITLAHTATWRRRWRRHITWERMGQLAEKFLIEDEVDEPKSTE